MGEKFTARPRPKRSGWRRRAGWSAAFAALAAAGIAAWVFRPVAVAAPPPFETLDASKARGAYLAAIGNCSACHTRPGGAALAGGVKFETPFGRIYSTNISPDPDHGIGKWSFADFHGAMKQGQRPDGTHLYPAFPYSAFARLSDQDIASLYAYLQDATPVARANRENAMHFPFGNRSLLHFWKRLFHDDAAFTPEEDRSKDWNRGAYLVEGIAHCGACHTPRNLLGGPKSGAALQGGIYTDQVASGAYRRWSAPDITPGPTGLSGWQANDIANYLRTGKNRHTVVHGPMGEVFAATRQLTDRDAGAIATYLAGIEPSEGRLDLSWLRSGNDAGETVYTVHCGTCHLPDGKGDAILGVPLHRSAVVQADDPSSLINVILYGPDLPGPPFQSGRTTMPAFGKKLSDKDIAALASFLRSSFGNNAGDVAPDAVARQR